MNELRNIHAVNGSGLSLVVQKTGDTPTALLGSGLSLAIGYDEEDRIVTLIGNGLSFTVNRDEAGVPLTITGNGLSFTVVIDDNENLIGTAGSGLGFTSQTNTNQAPVVNAGEDFEIQLPETEYQLQGSVTDDGLPINSTLTSLWSVVSKPEGATDPVFTDATDPETVVTFVEEGEYVLRLTASDTALETQDDVTATVAALPVVVEFVNTANNTEGGSVGAIGLDIETLDGDDRCLIATVLYNGVATISTIAYGGVALTRIQRSALNTSLIVEQWVLLNPAVGLQSLLCTFTGAISAPSLVACTFNNVGSIGDFDAAQINLNAFITAISVTVNDYTERDMVIDGLATNRTGISGPLSGQDVRWAKGGSPERYVSTRNDGTGPDAVMGWTFPAALGTSMVLTATVLKAP